MASWLPLLNILLAYLTYAVLCGGLVLSWVYGRGVFVRFFGAVLLGYSVLYGADIVVEAHDLYGALPYQDLRLLVARSIRIVADVSLVWAMLADNWSKQREPLV